MRVTIIEDKDVFALIDRLELKAKQMEGPEKPIPRDAFRAFRYVLVCWLQEQGCETVRK